MEERRKEFHFWFGMLKWFWDRIRDGFILPNKFFLSASKQKKTRIQSNQVQLHFCNIHQDQHHYRRASSFLTDVYLNKWGWCTRVCHLQSIEVVGGFHNTMVSLFSFEKNKIRKFSCLKIFVFMDANERCNISFHSKHLYLTFSVWNFIVFSKKFF